MGRLRTLNQQVEGSIPSRRTNILFPPQGPPGGRSNFSNDVESLSGYLDPMLSWPTGAFAITHGRAYNLHSSRSSWSHRGQAPGAGAHCLAGLEPNRPTVEGRAMRRHSRWSSSPHLSPKTCDHAPRVPRTARPALLTTASARISSRLACAVLLAIAPIEVRADLLSSLRLQILPVSVSIGYGPTTPDGSYLNAEDVANTLVFTTVQIQADSNIDFVDDMDLAQSTYGTPVFWLLSDFRRDRGEELIREA